MRTLIYNVKLVEADGISENGAVILRDGKIDFVSRDGAVILPAVDESIDGGGKYLSAGFIDIHVHGGGGHDFMDATEEAFVGAMAAHMQELSMSSPCDNTHSPLSPIHIGNNCKSRRSKRAIGGGV